MPIAAGTHTVYTVHPGDSLYTIANAFGTSVEDLVRINALYPPVTEPSLLYPGQTLLVRLPGMSQQSAALYQVEPGDTLHGIAERFGVGVELLAALNSLTQPDWLRVAQLLYVGAFVYEVEPGDTLFGISRRFGIPMQLLVRANLGRPGLSPDVIYPGFRLVVPLPSSTHIIAFAPLPGSRIAPGDRLIGIARAFEATVLYQIRDAEGGFVTNERFFTASEGGPAFGSFDTAIAFDRSPGTSSGFLLVYTRSAEDGSVRDLVEIPVSF